MNKEQNTENKDLTATFGNTMLYATFSVIPLDIEGSNIAEVGWFPSDDELRIMGEEDFRLAREEYILQNQKVLFKNVFLEWESCDCGDGYGCSHGSYVCEIDVLKNGKRIKIEYTDGDSLEFYNKDKYCKIPTAGATIFDFIRMCEICEIDLELSDYAVSLLK